METWSIFTETRHILVHISEEQCFSKHVHFHFHSILTDPLNDWEDRRIYYHLTNGNTGAQIGSEFTQGIIERKRRRWSWA